MVEFTNALWAGTLCQFIVESIDRQHPVGVVSCYNARHDAGTAYVAFSRVNSRSNHYSSHMLEGGYQFLEFVFSRWAFRKLYAEIPGYNWSQFASGAANFFEVEGTLTDHDFFDGQYWDLRIVSIRREQWESHRKGVFSTLYPGS
jgi:RimJ/RimL family protein N-acetyltransferase